LCSDRPMRKKVRGPSWKNELQILPGNERPTFSQNARTGMPCPN
jgi:hypothetical protein